MNRSRQPRPPAPRSSIALLFLAVLPLVTAPGGTVAVTAAGGNGIAPGGRVTAPAREVVAPGGRVTAPPGAGPPTPVGRLSPRAGADPPPTGGFRWPLDGAPRPVRRFDPPPRPWLPGHRGVDLAAGPGALVRAAGPGTVTFAGPVADRPVVAVTHPGGLRTTYEPVRPAVATGDRVSAGDPLGVLLPGHAGCPAAACLHWGLRRGSEYLDPLTLLGLGRVRLLPVVGPLGSGGGPGRLRRAGPAGRAARPRAGRTPPGGCRPGRRAATSRDRSTR